MNEQNTTTFARARVQDGRIIYGIVRNDVLEAICFHEDDFSMWNATGETFPFNDVTLCAPCAPSKIVAVGLNYRDHATELNLPLPSDPVIFLKPPTTVIGQYDFIVYPSGVTRLDYEAELAVVIRKRAYHIPLDEVEDYIFGYTCANDVTARDLQHKDGQWTRSKSFDTFCPLGPWIVRGISPSNLKIQCVHNGVVKQSSSTTQLIFPVPFLVHYISHVMTLLPGDVIITGTPSGIGPMQQGDRVEVIIEQIGTLVNTIR